MFKRRLTRGAASALPILFWLAAVPSAQPGGAGTEPWGGMRGWGVGGLVMGIMMLIF